MTKVTAATFDKCDVIVSNWTCHPVMTGGPWTPEGRSAFEKAIRGGVGMDNVDKAACKAKGVEAVNTPEASSVAVAALAVLWLARLEQDSRTEVTSAQ